MQRMVDLMASVLFPLRLEPELKDRLEAIAQNEDRSAIDIASDAIEAYVDAKEFKRLAIEAALAEAEKGVFISQEAMHRWMDSWGTDNELPPPEPDIFPSSGHK
jgi:predicted transcriptional regulator